MGEYFSGKLDALEQLTLLPDDGVRWLDLDADFAMIAAHYRACFGTEIARADFDEGLWRVCALVEDGVIRSFGGAMYMTETNWEIGAVSTCPEFRGRGYARRVCSFVARYILENGKQATCNTAADNHAMSEVMRAIGMVEQ